MSRRCPDCGVPPNTAHEGGCDVERCALCGGQAISCNCVYVVAGMDPSRLEEEHPDIYSGGATDDMLEAYDAAVEAAGGPLLWTGEWPGKAQCREFGFYSRWTQGPGGIHGRWEKCGRDDEGAQEGLNELYEKAVWDRSLRRFVLPS